MSRTFFKGLVVPTIFCLSLCAATVDAEVRTWKSQNGKYEIKAELIEATIESATLKTEKGERIVVPLEKLSQADRTFIGKWRRSGAKIPGVIPDRLGEPIDLLPAIDPKANTLSGEWRKQQDSLVSSAKAK